MRRTPEGISIGGGVGLAELETSELRSPDEAREARPSRMVGSPPCRKLLPPRRAGRAGGPPASAQPPLPPAPPPSPVAIIAYVMLRSAASTEAGIIADDGA